MDLPEDVQELRTTNFLMTGPEVYLQKREETQVEDEHVIDEVETEQKPSHENANLPTTFSPLPLARQNSRVNNPKMETNQKVRGDRVRGNNKRIPSEKVRSLSLFYETTVIQL
jgi:hypothetical protein